MQQVEYKNRDRDTIWFTEHLPDKVVMTHYLPLGVGVTGNVVGNKIPEPIAIDPSGGPYISVGDNLKYFFNDSVDRIVTKIEFAEYHGIIFTVTDKIKE